MDTKRTPDRNELYRGDGSTAGSRGLALPQEAPPLSFDSPEGYLAEPGLRAAVNVALRLGQPLLVTGEPGTGKTQLAASLAHELELSPPLVFNTKTTSTATDLFYRYDALGHFHAAQFREEDSSAGDFVTLEALGLATLLTLRPEEGDPHLPESLRGKGPIRSVVLVDEIDKAPRDLPNDVLFELEHMSFTIRETGRSFEADPRLRPILVLTSNSERSLPDPFLRRCIFFHISFPDRQRLREIVRRRLDGSLLSPQRLEAALRHFEAIRRLALRKKPATAELLAWLRIVEEMELDPEALRPGDLEALIFSYSVLAKSRDDLLLMQERLQEGDVES